ncbi:MFS transporter, partial [Streptomyces sp. SID10116]|nr:MFS transporter [Streptomyces sp. SID10116]
TGAVLAVLGLAVAGLAYAVDLRRGPVRGAERLVASSTPEHREPARS